MSNSPTLTIRGLHNDDWEQLFALFKIEEVVRASFELPYVSEESFRDRLNNPVPGQHVLIAEVGLPSGRKRVVGTANLQVFELRRRHSARLSLFVHPDEKGQLAETMLLRAALDLADQWLGLRRVDVLVYADDAAAMALYQRQGFELEATLRRYAFRQGDYCDVCLLARLRARRSSTLATSPAGQGETHHDPES